LSAVGAVASGSGDDMSADILNEVRVIAADVFAADAKTLNAGSSAEQVEAWAGSPLCWEVKSHKGTMP
jgi:hypothetical protein